MNQNLKRRQKRLRAAGQEPNADHQLEDNILHAEENDTDSSSINSNKSHQSKQVITIPVTTISTMPLLFSGRSKMYLGKIHYPFIIVETFKSCDTDEIVRGDLDSDIISKTKYLESILGVETTNSYCYFFKRADYKPHCVVDPQEATSILESAQKNRVTTMIAYSQSLRSALELPNSEFMFWSNKTKQFKTCFDESKIHFDLDFWHLHFDSNQSQDSYKRGFTDSIDFGFGREGVAETTFKTQARGKNYVSALPALINNKKLYRYFGNLLDCLQSIADKYVLDNGKFERYPSECEINLY